MLRVMDTAERVRENRLREAVARQGYRLSRSRRRDPRAVDYGRYTITNGTATPVAELPNLDAVEAWTNREER
jgi:hypothetical protein